MPTTNSPTSPLPRLLALTYAHRKVDIIPDSIVDLGHADDSERGPGVILQNERALEKYARARALIENTAEPKHCRHHHFRHGAH